MEVVSKIAYRPWCRHAAHLSISDPMPAREEKPLFFFQTHFTLLKKFVFSLITISFWIGSALLVYTFFGYPVLIHILGKIRAAKTHPFGEPSDEPSVSVVLVVRNEGNRIIERIQNLLATDFPLEKIEVILVSDGSTDDTIQKLADIDTTSICAIDSPSHRGKPACLNDGIAAASGEIIILTDARQQFTKSTIPALVSPFSDAQTGAVSGELIIGESGSGVGAGVDAYWKLEKAIRLGESHFDSSIGCTGAVYAVRKSLFTPLPEDTLIDDVVCPMLISLKDKRVLFCPEALAYDPQILDPVNEKRRKRRTIAGNFQMLFRYPSWLLPWKNRLALQLISHKYLRLLAPVLMVGVFFLNLALAADGSPFFVFTLITQCAFYALSFIGMTTRRLRWKCFTLPAGFVFLNMMTVRGFVYYIQSKGRAGWK
jgi:cellulose synthase/poly-beta-1,6-N-acetylglucosamine synthase-like glycosyltransferase